jgi:hypothetical protein
MRKENKKRVDLLSKERKKKGKKCSPNLNSMG